jgi:putative ABC transport system ATP-binding protein
MALLEGRNLRKTYRLGRRNLVAALNGVDIDVETGEMVAIMGPSGSGKSTLMHILGLLHAPDQADGPAPELRLSGRDVARASDADRTRIRSRQIGFVFQEFNLVPTLSALENVMLVGQFSGAAADRSRLAALAALDLVGLAERTGHRPAELSGGEQQRVAIARALSGQPQLILADEPTGNLDSARAAEILALLRRFNREQGQTIVLVTHDEQVGAACDRTVHMRDGRIAEAQASAAQGSAAPWTSPFPTGALPGGPIAVPTPAMR